MSTSELGQISGEQIAFFRENGYLAIGAITTPDEVAWLRDVYDRLFQRRAGRDQGDQFDLAGADEEGKEASLPQILQPSKYAPELAGTACRANAVAIARQLLGPDASYTGEHAILKPARHGAPTPWHQDEAYWDPGTEYAGLSVWIPLQDATIENGCMWFVPGSHNLDVLPHRSIGNDVRVHGLELDVADFDLGSAVACPIPAGGATFHLSTTLHYTGPNLTDQPRRAYIVTAGKPPKPRAAVRDFWWQKNKRTARMDRAASSGKLKIESEQ